MAAGALAGLRHDIRLAIHTDAGEILRRLADAADLDLASRGVIVGRATALVEKVRARSSSGMLEGFLAEYSLSTTEGIALMCLAEALLRVPDTRTIDDLIEDKIAPSRWAEHLDRANSPLVNVSTLALTLTGEVLRDGGAGIAGTLKSIVQRIGEPVIRSAVLQAMKILGGQFVLGQTIEEATRLARRQERAGFTYSYDMLGEAARTAADAEHYLAAYAEAITVLAPRCTAEKVRDNPGVSVKLSALHPRYEFSKRDRVMSELVERTVGLARLARDANMGFNLDAEEAERLDLSLDVIAAVLADPGLAGWEGFGIVVQAYGPRAGAVIDWIDALATSIDRRVMVRLVKGAYWDSEIKRAQILGLDGFPVFTRKAATDVSFIANARKLLGKRHRVYPQFATHNAHTAAAVLHLANELGATPAEFEFQRLHGMGERLHDILVAEAGTRTRIYAPVGRHVDLLAYLVRRLLENGANGSFVNMIANRNVRAEDVARDPFEALAESGENVRVKRPSELFAPQRRNSRGVDLSDPHRLERLEIERRPFVSQNWTAGPMIAGASAGEAVHQVTSPATGEVVGTVAMAAARDVDTALAAAKAAAPVWAARPARERAELLRRTADLYEAHAPELFALAAREAGKTLPDSVGEVREAVDFLRYYAAEVETAEARRPLGVFACISPWNFPLAIFTGQIAAALVAGNTVVAKPAEATSLMAARAVALMHDAGIPAGAIQLLPGDGAIVGAALCADPRIDGICFTGSLATAKAIDRAMAGALAPDAPLIAETGGLNAMIVDSTALPEQAVRDILASAFQSAGQRCSALRMLYVQQEAAERLLAMLFGAMDELAVGDPWQLATDIGPVIDRSAWARIEAYVADFAARDAVLKRIAVPGTGLFVAPTVLKVGGIADLSEEIFGPVLHVATFEAGEIDEVVAAINASGYGLTFGLHTRIDARVEEITGRIRVGNIYVNRNQIGAVVGVQPFGGEGLSGTGPKAGGPFYLERFSRPRTDTAPSSAGNDDPVMAIAEAIAAVEQVRLGLAEVAQRPVRRTLAGPTGESNTLLLYPRGVVLCLGPDRQSAEAQARMALERGNAVLVAAPDGRQIAAALGKTGAVICGVDKRIAPAAIEAGLVVDAIAHFGDAAALRPLRLAISRRDGPILPLIASPADAGRLVIERLVCIDTTAAGGNAELLAPATPSANV